MKRGPAFKHIGFRILVYSLILSAVTVAGTGALVLLSSQRALKRQVRDTSLQLARRAAEEISLYFSNARGALCTSAELLSVTHRSPSLQDVILDTVAGNFGQYSVIYTVDRQGRTTRSTGDIDQHARRGDSDALRRVLSDGTTFISSARLARNGIPFVTIGMPVTSLGDIREALFADLSLTDVWELIDEIAVGRSGFAMLVATDGTLIADRDKSNVLTQTISPSLRSVLESVPPEGEVSEIRIERSGLVLAARAPVQGTDWVVVLNQPLYDAYLYAAVMRWWTLLLVCAGVAIAGLASVLLTRSVARPLGVLVEGVRIMGEGRLEQRIELNSGDELGTLAECINDMAAALARNIEDLRESETRYRLLTENAQDIIFSLDHDYRVLHANQIAETTLGYALAESQGRSLLHIVSDESKEEAVAALERLAARQESSAEEVDVDLITAGGEVRTFRVRLTRDVETGNDAHYYGVARDITERLELDKKLVRSDRLSSIGELVSGVAHELNNPLTTIMGHAQLLLGREDLPEDGKNALRTVLSESGRCARIIRNLLGISRDTPEQVVPTQLNLVAKSVLEVREYDTRVSGIETQTLLAEDLPEALADPDQIRQIVLNLVNNAIQAMEKVEGERRLTMRTFAKGGHVVLEVSDTGTGIDPEHISKVFDPFFTTKPVGVGTGLGLSVSKSIAQAHDGDLVVEHGGRNGATFRLTLPMLERPGSDKAVGEVSEAHGPASQKPLGVRALVVDDEEQIRKLLALILEQDGCEVDTADDGRSALELLAKHDYQLVVSDLRMPGIDGPELYRRLKESMPEHPPKMIFITGDIVGAAAQSFLQESGAPYIKKPFTFETFREVVRRELGRE